MKEQGYSPFLFLIGNVLHTSIAMYTDLFIYIYLFIYVQYIDVT